MNKVSVGELNKKLKECEIGIDYETIKSTPFLGVFHYHEWDHGYETTYGFNGSRREFYADMREMTKFLINYFNVNDVEDVIVAPFHNYRQFDERYYNSFEMPGKDIFDEIRLFLRNYGIRKGERSGIHLSFRRNMDILEMLLEGSFRGVSNLCFFVLEQRVLIEPNHHFDLVFRARDFDTLKSEILNLLPIHPNLRYFDMTTKKEF